MQNGDKILVPVLYKAQDGKRENAVIDALRDCLDGLPITTAKRLVGVLLKELDSYDTSEWVERPVSHG